MEGGGEKEEAEGADLGAARARACLGQISAGWGGGERRQTGGVRAGNRVSSLQ